MSDIGLAVSGNGLFRVTLTQDDIAHRWTALHVVNNDTRIWTIAGDLNGTAFSFAVNPGVTLDHAITVNLIEVVNQRGVHGWVPSLNGTTPMPYSIGVSGG